MVQDNTDNNDEQSLPDEGSLDEAINAFKGILEVFPEDIGALESIFAACVQAEYKEEALDYGIKLAECQSAQGEWKKVRNTTEKLIDLGIKDERVEVLHQTAIDSIPPEETSATESELLPDHKPPASSGGLTEEVSETLRRSLSGELDLAWMLLQNGVITEDQYEKAVSSLSESQSSSSSKASICLLQELTSIDHVKMDKVLGFLSAETNTPYIDIDRFEIDLSIAKLASLGEARRYGVLPFGQLKDELMVAILNPVDDQVRLQASRYFGRTLHFFLCSPEALQKVIDNLEAQANSTK